MITLFSEPPKSTVVSDRRVTAVSAGRPFRLGLPALYAAIGVSLGSLAGAAIALGTDTPNGQSVVAQIASAARSLVTETSVKADSYPAWAPTDESRQTLAAGPTHASRTAKIKAERSAPDQAPASTATANDVAKSRRATAMPRAPQKAPAEEKSAQPSVVPEDVHPSQPVAHPVKKTPRKELASLLSADSAIEATPAVAVNSSGDEAAPMGDSAPMMEGLGDGSEAKALAFYSEGDLTVTDYNASSGTIESSDGRTFLVGPTVTVSNATSWNEYRAGVHYRCDQSGSCMLMRPGVVASNARVI